MPDSTTAAAVSSANVDTDQLRLVFYETGKRERCCIIWLQNRTIQQQYCQTEITVFILSTSP